MAKTAEKKTIKKEEVKETPTVEETKPKGPTLRERINKVVDSNEDKEELKKAIFALVQRVQFPDQFCPECDDRLFLNGQTYECLNCGYTRQLSVVAPIVTRPVAPATPTAGQSTTQGKIPEQVEKVISEAEQNMDERRSLAPNSKGERIRKLAESLGDSAVAPTRVDEDRLKNSDPNVRDVNWV